MSGRIIKCSKCDVEFQCRAQQVNCWCNNYQLSKKQLTALKGTYDDCLCEKCISELSQELK